jgi:hypothetical protein
LLRFEKKGRSAVARKTDATAEKQEEVLVEFYHLRLTSNQDLSNETNSNEVKE